MSGITMRLLVGVFVLGFASCSNKCPDGTVCQDSETCCKGAVGYGCCPYPKAVCCLDYEHCCPSGYRCNLATQMCEKKNQPWASIPMGRKREDAEEPSAPVLSTSPLQRLKDNKETLLTALTAARNGINGDGGIPCDSKSYCPDGETCCQGPKGQKGCCPYPQGQCCADGMHCCPNGYTCDASSKTCNRNLPKLTEDAL